MGVRVVLALTKKTVAGKLGVEVSECDIAFANINVNVDGPAEFAHRTK